MRVGALGAAASSLLAGSCEIVAHGEVPRPALALLREGRHVGAVFGRAGEDRRQVLAEMLMLAVALPADALVLVQDAWTSAPPVADGRGLVPPSEDPEAVEAIIEVRAVRGHPMLLILHPYSRDDRGRVRFGETTRFEGELAGVVPDLLAKALAAQVLPGLPVESVARQLSARGHQVVFHPAC